MKESDFIKLTKNNHPPLNSVIELTDGNKIITAKWNGDSFTWIPKQFESGVCMVIKPTHWRL